MTFLKIVKLKLRNRIFHSNYFSVFNPLAIFQIFSKLFLYSISIYGQYMVLWDIIISSRKTYISALLTMPKPLTVYFTINCGKF